MEEFIHISLALNVEAAIGLFLAKLASEDRAIVERVFEAEKVNIADELGADVGDDIDLDYDDLDADPAL